MIRRHLLKTPLPHLTLFSSTSTSRYNARESTRLHRFARRDTAPSASFASKAKSHPLSEVMNLCKRRGFVLQGSEIYGGFSSTWDLGPLGVTLKNRLIGLWWRDFVERRLDCVGVETGTMLHPEVWRASGHLDEFVDPLSECGSCHFRVRADHVLVEDGMDAGEVERMSFEELGKTLVDRGISCPSCGESGTLGVPREFNLLFRTEVGPLGDGEAYLRPETAQGAFIQYAALSGIARSRLPLGVAQVGRSFRNEIAPRNFLFRTREFDQAELQYFVRPEEADAAFEQWVDECESWMLQFLKPDRVRRREYVGEELAHYARATVDLEYEYPFGWGEVWGVANRGDFDLQKHTKASGRDLRYQDPLNPSEPFFPFVIEPALGVQRLLLAILCDAMETDSMVDAKGKVTTRQVLRLHPDLAPFRAAVLPLSKKPQDLIDVASDLHQALLFNLGDVDYDIKGAIGRRYRRHDEIGTPFCITVDHDSLQDNEVTVRFRDSSKQTRVPIDLLKSSHSYQHFQTIINDYSQDEVGE